MKTRELSWWDHSKHRLLDHTCPLIYFGSCCLLFVPIFGSCFLLTAPACKLNCKQLLHFFFFLFFMSISITWSEKSVLTHFAYKNTFLLLLIRKEWLKVKCFLFLQVDFRKRRSSITVQRTGPQPCRSGTFQVCEALSAVFWVCY